MNKSLEISNSNNNNYACVFITKKIIKMELEALNITIQLILSDVVFQLMFISNIFKKQKCNVCSVNKSLYNMLIFV